MKKLIAFGVVVALVSGIWWQYSSRVNRIKDSVQGDSVRTVERFMDGVVKFSGLLWDEKKMDALKKDAEQAEASVQRGDEQRAQDIFEKYGLESPARLFKDELLGRAAATCFSFFHLESYSITHKQIGEDSATVTVEFLPSDVFGLRKILSKRGAPTGEPPKKPVVATFHLKKSWHRWHIVNVSGELEKIIEATRRLRKRK